MNPLSFITPESMVLEGLRLYAAGLRGQVHALDTISPLPSCAPKLLVDVERHLLSGGELHTLPDDALCLGAQVLLQTLEMYPSFAALVRKTERGQAGYRAVWLMEREVQRRVQAQDARAGLTGFQGEPVFVSALRSGVMTASAPELLGVGAGPWHKSLRIDVSRQVTGRSEGEAGERPEGNEPGGVRELIARLQDEPGTWNADHAARVVN